MIRISNSKEQNTSLLPLFRVWRSNSNSLTKTWHHNFFYIHIILLLHLIPKASEKILRQSTCPYSCVSRPMHLKTANILKNTNFLFYWKLMKTMWHHASNNLTIQENEDKDNIVQAYLEKRSPPNTSAQEQDIKTSQWASIYLIMGNNLDVANEKKDHIYIIFFRMKHNQYRYWVADMQLKQSYHDLIFQICILYDRQLWGSSYIYTTR